MQRGFTAATTTDDILAGRDLNGFRVLVTGVSAGMGVETARALAAHGATVVGTARHLAKARIATEAVQAEATSGGSLELITLDLASLASVRACADVLLATHEAFDLVIANAGVMAGPEGVTAEGFETQFGTNYLGHFVFINRIAGLLKPGARVVMVSSAGHRRADVDIDDPDFKRTPYHELTAYGRSKTATILFAVEFDRRHKAAGVRATSVHPGAVMTETVRTMVEAMGDGKEAALSAYNWKTVSQGAATALWAGIAAAADEVGGRYCEDCRVAQIDDDPGSRSGVRSYALDLLRAQTLWARSEYLVGEQFQRFGRL